MLEIRGLTRPGLDPVDLDLADGEAVAIMGPSGAGKSLLLRAIADLDPSEGRIALDGRSREALPAPAWRRRVTYLAAEPGWWATRAGDHFPQAEAAGALLPAVGLAPEILDRPIAELSTGERHRLALVRVLLQEPRVLLLDEPTSGLDPDAAGAVEALLRERLRTGVALLIATHDAQQAGRLAKRHLRIERGRITERAS